MMKNILKVSGNQIIDGKTPVRLKGVNFGGWLMMEGYFLCAPNRPVRLMKQDFARRLGDAALQELEQEFLNRFIRRKDFETAGSMGCNCLRLPFHYGLIETAPYTYDLDGVRRLDQSIRWAGSCGMRVILDLHAALGAQNHDWHSDSLGKAGLWTNRTYQKRTIALWQFLADRYKDDPVVAGYDLLNEAVTGDVTALNAFYARLIKEVRAADPHHILFVEGNAWATDIQCLDRFQDDNWAYSIHFYHPIDFTFQFVPQLRYPLRSGRQVFGKGVLRRMIQQYKTAAGGRPVLVGEFGVNARNGLVGEDDWLRDILECFDEAGFHWTYWTYKALKNHMFPDGIYSYYPNDPWVSRHGPRYGWETWADLWPTMKSKIVRSWETDRFQANTPVLRVLKKYLR